MKHFPLYIALTDKNILVIGGGHIAERRITTLLSFEPRITVIAPVITEKLQEYVAHEQILWIPAALQMTSQLELQINGNKSNTSHHFINSETPVSFQSILSEFTPYLILTATDDRSVNHMTGLIAKHTNTLFNTCDCPEECDFYFPAIIEEKGVIASITANGKDHALVRLLASKIRDLLHDSIK